MSLEQFITQAKQLPGGTLRVDYDTQTHADGSIYGTELLDFSYKGQSVLYNHSVQFDDWREFDEHSLNRRQNLLAKIHKKVEWTYVAMNVNSDGSVNVECLRDGKPTYLSYDSRNEFDDDPRFK